MFICGLSSRIRFRVFRAFVANPISVFGNGLTIDKANQSGISRVMFRLTVLALCLAAITAVVTCGKQSPESDTAKQNQGPASPIEIRPGLWIVEPADQDSAPYRPYVIGTISDRTVQEVWLIVHLGGAEEYWGQPLTARREDGVWLNQPHVGLADTPAGVGFEIRAFAKLRTSLEPGTMLNGWPEAKLSSNTVTLIRQ